MPARPAVPAPKPLSPRAAQFVRKTVQQQSEQTNDRQRAFLKGFDAGVDSLSQPAAPVRKAKSAEKPQMVAIYDANGNLVGMADPDDITILADAKAPGGPDSPPADLAAAPAASVGTPADAVPVPAAKAMSGGAKGHQLGGDNPRGGVPVIPAEDVEEEVAKARVQALSAGLKKSLNGGSACSAAEQVAISNAMNAAALAKYQEMRQRGQVGAPRRP